MGFPYDQFFKKVIYIPEHRCAIELFFTTYSPQENGFKLAEAAISPTYEISVTASLLCPLPSTHFVAPLYRRLMIKIYIQLHVYHAIESRVNVLPRVFCYLCAGQT